AAADTDGWFHLSAHAADARSAAAGAGGGRAGAAAPVSDHAVRPQHRRDCRAALAADAGPPRRAGAPDAATASAGGGAGAALRPAAEPEWAGRCRYAHRRDSR